MARPFGGKTPIRCHLTIAPGSWAVGLVVQICPSHAWLAPVALGEHHPVRDPALLRYVIRIPEGRLPRGIGPVSIEDHPEATSTRTLNHTVHDLEPRQTLQIRILDEVDPVRGTGCVEELVAVRQADRVKATEGNLIQHLLPVSHPQSVRAERPPLHAEPAHTGQIDDSV